MLGMPSKLWHAREYGLLFATDKRNWIEAMNNATELQVLGPVHTYPFSFENATFSSRIGLPSTRIRWKRWPKTRIFENALQSRNVWKLRFRVSCGWWKRNFSKTMTSECWIQATPLYPAREAARKKRSQVLETLYSIATLRSSSTSSSVQTNESALLLPLDLPRFSSDCGISKLFPGFASV